MSSICIQDESVSATGGVSLPGRAQLCAPDSVVQPDPGVGERPIFVSDDGWRHRAVGAAIALAGALLLGWLAAIVAGALGFGSLPALPFGAKAKDTPAAPVAQPTPNRPELSALTSQARASVLAKGSHRRLENPASASTHTGGGAGSSQAAPQASSGIESHAVHAPTFPRLETPASTPNREGASLPPAGASNGSPSGGGSAGKGGGGSTGTAEGGSTETAAGGAGGAPGVPSTEARQPPAVTPSGHEVPSGSASGPSENAAAAREGNVGAERRAPTAGSG